MITPADAASIQCLGRKLEFDFELDLEKEDDCQHCDSLLVCEKVKKAIGGN